ncbi:hypothetical protein SAMN06264364_13110 [Quadrisphaera granulorum]|uniref:Maltokinase N-terminal cap domain-containing protein n=1 Tax=Quadrisphaera granulorum TaxID=317664 RepID=A0A315ZRW7_9ACTN|nr:hypothetical protein [Quadrisphaera granulorum]PWJ48286.1 hypothetical protein BXY45_13110 [Quadrisphaera granulorum]SZE98447.1 hypothetical protein SAMN06264364_13110 [Quadrisphaera granulorum]
MAVHHQASIVPTKAELLAAWVPRQPWAAGADTSSLTKLGSYRFDDPDGEVGMETHVLATADGQVLQVPLTYRGAPRAGAEESLVTTMTHTTLGDRWIYDALHDPVYAAVLASTIATGGHEADLFLSTPDGLVLQPASARVRGSGTAPSAPAAGWSGPRVTVAGTTSRIECDGALLTVLHVLETTTASAAADELVLTGTWLGQDRPVLLAVLR